MSPVSPCTDPDAHVDSAAGFLREVEAACRDRGLRLTPLRVEVLELVAAAAGPVKAYDLLDRMRRTRGSVAPPTVYRALDFLLEHGFIHRLASVNAFIACHHPRSEQHSVPFLICNVCDRAVELEDEQTARTLERQARAHGFEPEGHTLEVRGRCSSCVQDKR